MNRFLAAAAVAALRQGRRTGNGFMRIRGTQGYAGQADEIAERYEAIGFRDKQEAVLQLLPAAPAWVLDIGAGTRADASWLAD